MSSIIQILDIRTFIGYIYRISKLLLDLQTLDIKTFIRRTNIGYENCIGYIQTLDITDFTS